VLVQEALKSDPISSLSKKNEVLYALELTKTQNFVMPFLEGKRPSHVLHYDQVHQTKIAFKPRFFTH